MSTVIKPVVDAADANATAHNKLMEAQRAAWAATVKASMPRLLEPPKAYKCAICSLQFTRHREHGCSKYCSPECLTEGVLRGDEDEWDRFH